MQELRRLEERIATVGRVDGQDLELLRQALYADGKIDREEADFLAELHKRVRNRTHAFEQFFYQALKDYVLADGEISAEEAVWLRQLVFADGKIDDQERRFLHELRGEAKQVCPEFEALFAQAMKEPPEQHTSGG
jgi:hypothetical protein